MKILTVRRPWASAIVHGGKDVENRTRNIAGSYRGPVAIHAGLTYDEDAVLWDETSTPHVVDEVGDHREPRGAIIGVVDLVDVHHASDSMACVDWAHGVTDAGQYLNCSLWAQRDAYHLVLANPRALATPLLYRGALGLRELPADVVARIVAQLPVCPDCRDGKCRNCAGQALNQTTDEIVACGCPRDGHKEATA